MWQALREELHAAGLEIVTVGIDAAGAEACRPFIEAANPRHPSLIDVGHVVAERFGVVNIPNGIWIDEDGVIVRPVEPAFVSWKAIGVDRERPSPLRNGSPSEIPQRVLDMLTEASKLKPNADGYVAALRDWVANGAASRFALGPDEVVARSGRRDRDVAEAAAHFGLAQHLWRAAKTDDAVRHFREAHRLQPENIAYKRQAWSLATPEVTGPLARFWQGPVEGHEEAWPYESDWLTEVRAMGAENYYPELDL